MLLLEYNKGFLYKKNTNNFIFLFIKYVNHNLNFRK